MGKINLAIIALTALMLSQAARADKISCHNDTANEDACFLIEKDLATIWKQKFANISPLHEKLFGNSPNGAGKFALRYLRRIEILRSGSALMAASAKGHTLYIYPLYFKQKLARRLASLIHEARHLGPAPHDHIRCPSPYVWTLGDVSIPKPNLAGREGCDKDEFGAYSYSYVYLSSLERSCTNCESLSKKEISAAKKEVILHFPDSEVVKRLIEGSQ